jgi:hypothetical protein
MSEDFEPERVDRMAADGARIHALEARVAELEGLLRDLTAMEGPQPGNIDWYKRVLAALEDVA